LYNRVWCGVDAWEAPALSREVGHVCELGSCKYGVKIAGGFSLLAHATDVNDLLEGLDGVLEDGLDRLHDTEAALHIVNLGLHALDGLHFTSDLDERLTIVKSLENAGSESLLDVLNGGSLGNGGIGITLRLGLQGRVESAAKSDVHLIEVHRVIVDLGFSLEVGGSGLMPLLPLVVIADGFCDILSHASKPGFLLSFNTSPVFIVLGINFSL
jgi:hypothetical protein